MTPLPPAPPPAWDWLPDLSAVEAYLTALLHVCAIAQTAFVILWLILPWWKEWIGRALMVKSAALMLFLDFSLLVHYVGVQWWRPYVSAALFTLVTVGIVSQVIALPYEMVSASRGRRQVTGTESDTPPAADNEDRPALR